MPMAATKRMKKNTAPPNDTAASGVGSPSVAADHEIVGHLRENLSHLRQHDRQRQPQVLPVLLPCIAKNLYIICFGCDSVRGGKGTNFGPNNLVRSRKGRRKMLSGHLPDAKRADSPSGLSARNGAGCRRAPCQATRSLTPRALSDSTTTHRVPRVGPPRRVGVGRGAAAGRSPSSAVSAPTP